MTCNTKNWAEKEKQRQLWTPGPFLRGVHGSQFHMESSASKPHSSYFDSLCIPFSLPPTTPSLSPADGGSFVHQHPGNNIKGLLGVNADCLKNNTKLKNKELPEGMGDIQNSTPEREGKELLCTGENKEAGRGVRKERIKESKQERKKYTLSCSVAICQTSIIYSIHKGMGWVTVSLMATINKWH